MMAKYANLLRASLSTQEAGPAVMWLTTASAVAGVFISVLLAVSLVRTGDDHGRFCLCRGIPISADEAIIWLFGVSAGMKRSHRIITMGNQSTQTYSAMRVV